MDVLTLYVGQGDLTAIRSGSEAIIVDAHMPNCDDVTKEQIEASLNLYLSKRHVRGLVLTGFDNDHAHPPGVESILKTYEPDWVMYPKYYKDTDAATEVFPIIEREVRRRANASRPLSRLSVRLDRVDQRILNGLATNFEFELFSPHVDDMDSSNNSSIVLKVKGLDALGFTYLITGDTETERWESINRYFGSSLASDVLAAPHHGSKNGVNARTLLLVSPNTVLISAGVNNPHGHPDSSAVEAYQKVARHVFCTKVKGGVCLLTRRTADDFETTPGPHRGRRAAA